MWSNNHRFRFAIASAFCLSLCGAATLAAADIINVPDDFPTIQAAIDAAADGDEIIVAPGTYLEMIDFLGKAIDLHSSDGPEVTIIDARSTGTVVTCESGEGPDTILDGLTITGGLAPFGGGGMRNINSSPTVSNCIFDSNFTAGNGGGMYNEDAAPAVIDCIFSLNQATDSGGGMFGDNSHPVVNACLFEGNVADDGGGMTNTNGSDPLVMACTFQANVACFAGGINIVDGAGLITDTAFIDNTANEEGGGSRIERSNTIVSGCEFRANICKDDEGGGMFMHNADAMILDCSFVVNDAAFGGGMNIRGGKPVVSQCSFLANDASDGGGIDVHMSTVLVTACSFEGHDIFQNGGGIALGPGADATISDCVFASNSAEDGAGIYMFTLEELKATVTDCLFADNHVEKKGAGLYNRGGEVLIRDCVFTRNGADGEGGGVYVGGDEVVAGGDAAIQGCDFVANVALHGGALFASESLASAFVANSRFIANTALANGGGVSNESLQMSLVNCLFTGNASTLVGGAIHNDPTGPVTVVNCTMGGNVAEHGGGMSLSDATTVTGCILWGNTGGSFAGGGGQAVVVYSNIEGGHAGVGNIDVDPMFIDPDNGDYRLSAGSPCIDAADNTAVPKDIMTDLDGNPRFVDDPDTKDTGNGRAPIVDMGAYEFQVVASCTWDLDGDDVVGTGDLILLLGSWGDPYGTADLIELLGNWGPCDG